MGSSGPVVPPPGGGRVLGERETLGHGELELTCGKNDMNLQKNGRPLFTRKVHSGKSRVQGLGLALK